MVKKFALITGASGGIGGAVAHCLARQGYSLYLHYNTGEETIHALVNELSVYGADYLPVKADLGRNGGYQEILPGIFELDSIIHCGGNSVYGLFQDLKDEDAERLMNIHVLNPMLLTRSLLPKLLAKKSGSIIMVSSIWGQTGAACEVAYSAVKGAQISFVKALAKELAPSGIRVNAVAPGAVGTSMLQQFSGDELEMITGEIPIGRLAFPEEIANGVEFLLSDKASYITGHVLGINGGWHT